MTVRVSRVATAHTAVRDKLTATHGRDIVLPELLPLIADGPRSRQIHDSCGAHYANLAETTAIRQASNKPVG